MVFLTLLMTQDSWALGWVAETPAVAKSKRKKKRVKKGPDKYEAGQCRTKQLNMKRKATWSRCPRVLRKGKRAFAGASGFRSETGECRDCGLQTEEWKTTMTATTEWAPVPSTVLSPYRPDFSSSPHQCYKEDISIRKLGPTGHITSQWGSWDPPLSQPLTSQPNLSPLHYLLKFNSRCSTHSR